MLLRSGELYPPYTCGGQRAAEGPGRDSRAVRTSSPGPCLAGMLPHRKPFWRLSVETVRTTKQPQLPQASSCLLLPVSDCLDVCQGGVEVWSFSSDTSLLFLPQDSPMPTDFPGPKPELCAGDNAAAAAAAAASLGLSVLCILSTSLDLNSSGAGIPRGAWMPVSPRDSAHLRKSEVKQQTYSANPAKLWPYPGHIPHSVCLLAVISLPRGGICDLQHCCFPLLRTSP